MGYKEKLGIKKNGSITVFNDKIDNYFKERGFYLDTMNPRFMNGYDYHKLTLGLPVLRFDSTNNEGYTTRVFMNYDCIYVEVQTPYRSYESSNYVSFKDRDWAIDSYEELEEYLDSVLE